MFGALAIDETRITGLLEAADVLATARLIVENIAFWAVHRHWDPHPQQVDDRVAEDTVVAFVVKALSKE